MSAGATQRNRWISATAERGTHGRAHPDRNGREIGPSSVRLESMDRVLSREHRLVARLSTCAGSDRFEQEVFHVQWIVPIVEQRCCRHIGDRLARLAVEHEKPVAEVEKIL